MMKYNHTLFSSLLACFSFALMVSGLTNSVYAEQKILSGEITDIVNVPSYTYAEVNLGKKKVWVAGPVTGLKVGEKISFSAGMPMENFHSKSMKRDFSVVYFVSRFITANGATAGKSKNLLSPHAQIKKKKVTKPIKGINKVEEGFSISEIHKDKHKLKGKILRVRGKVTKFTAEVMGKNWLHIRDSSTLDDLTVTTKDTVARDDIVVIEGKLALDKDFSYGYIYPVILLDAKVVK